MALWTGLVCGGKKKQIFMKKQQNKLRIFSLFPQEMHDQLKTLCGSVNEYVRLTVTSAQDLLLIILKH